MMMLICDSKKQNSQSWDLSPQMSDYQVFHVIGHQLKGILLYLSIKIIRVHALVLSDVCQNLLSLLFLFPAAY